MPRAATLAQAGFSQRQSTLLGVVIEDIAGAGTSQEGAAEIGSATCVIATTDSGETAFVLPGNVTPGHRIEFYCTTAETALVFPESGADIDNGSANASVSVAQDKARVFRKVADGKWKSLPGS